MPNGNLTLQNRILLRTCFCQSIIAKKTRNLSRKIWSDKKGFNYKFFNLIFYTYSTRFIALYCVCCGSSLNAANYIVTKILRHSFKLFNECKLLLYANFLCVVLSLWNTFSLHSCSCSSSSNLLDNLCLEDINLLFWIRRKRQPIVVLLALSCKKTHVVQTDQSEHQFRKNVYPASTITL